MVESSVLGDGNNMEQLGVMLYMGANKVQVLNEHVVNANRQMITAMSQPLALVNKTYFLSQLKANMDGDLLEQIQQVDLANKEQPLCDNYGRVTYFYAQLADKRIPVY